MSEKNAGCRKCKNHKYVDESGFGGSYTCKKIKEKRQSPISGVYYVNGNCEELNKNLDCKEWEEKHSFMNKIFAKF